MLLKKSGHIPYVYKANERERTIFLPKLPPLIINQYYHQKNHERYPILQTIWLQQSNYKKKIILLDEINLENDKELRLRYYIIGKEKSVRGKWVFGQFATILPRQDFHKLIKLAKKHRIISADSLTLS